MRSITWLIALSVGLLSQIFFQPAAQAQCVNAANGPKETLGCWSEILQDWPGGAIQSNLLPDGTVAFWGRPEQSATDNANIWDPNFAWDFTPGADRARWFRGIFCSRWVSCAC